MIKFRLRFGISNNLALVLPVGLSILARFLFNFPMLVLLINSTPTSWFFIISFLLFFLPIDLALRPLLYCVLENIIASLTNFD